LIFWREASAEERNWGGEEELPSRKCVNLCPRRVAETWCFHVR